MSETDSCPFLKFLKTGDDGGGFETDDVLAAVIPLMKQVQAAHEAGLVAPLDGLKALQSTDASQLKFNPTRVHSPEKNIAKVEAMQSPVSHAMDVVSESKVEADLDREITLRSDLSVGVEGEAVTKPVHVAGYHCWEHAIGHHDELTDIYSLGMILASVACGLDFTDPSELEVFSANRINLFRVEARLNPVIAAVIVEMTELNRHRRAQDLGQLISRLENYREQALDFETNFFSGEDFKSSPVTGKRRLIQSHLRDRLFDISRRNRLLHFKPTLQTLNLTVASVPLVLDYRNIQLSQLFVWHQDLAETIIAGKAMPLGRYLRFEDAPYISGVLDKIISEARKDRAEYGFAQLRLVLCFFRWHNLKECPEERIHSPLLLLPVQLTKKKGVRDSYVLESVSQEAEINPALRHHLKELYDLNLPEFLDLKVTSLDSFYELLKQQIHSSEPGVTFNKLDRPRIELIQQKARQRLDQYQRRLKRKTLRVRAAGKPEYSYKHDDLRPLGLKLFLEKIRPTPIPLGDALGSVPAGGPPNMVAPTSTGNILEAQEQRYALQDANNSNPYSWDFDLCSMTLGNFNYRKMTLVRDYSNLIETDLPNRSFDTIFSLEPRRTDDTEPETLDLDSQHIVVACDATQASAISRARTGESYIIQGPPGTGKSQTITNLIADYVARGKRVLFVCEKRAAIDVVFHRLRQQGLDELCCLIHDSQTDKKAFIHNLKQTYEQFLEQGDLDEEAENARKKTVKAMMKTLGELGGFSSVMEEAHAHTGLPVRGLLHRLVELGEGSVDLSAELEDLLPGYPLWMQHGETIEQLHSALVELGEPTVFSEHPFRCVGGEVLQSDRPLETLGNALDEAEDLLDAIENALELSGLPGELWDTFEEIRSILEFAVQVQPLIERDLVHVLTGGANEKSFNKLRQAIEKKQAAAEKARENSAGWMEPLSPEDTETALAQAEQFEKGLMRFLRPGYWKLKKVLQTHYDFSRHSVAPSWKKILSTLAARHQADAALESAREEAMTAWQVEELEPFLDQVDALKKSSLTRHPSIAALLEQLKDSAEAQSMVGNLVTLHGRFGELDQVLGRVLIGHEQLELPELTELMKQLRSRSDTLLELLPVLKEVNELPEPLMHALRYAPIPLNAFETFMGMRSLNHLYREDRAISRVEGPVIDRKMAKLRKHYREWLDLNARCLRRGVRRKFIEHVNISSTPAAQLEAEQKVFKKEYASGRKGLEHEFGKTMRYKSIRDLAAGNTGKVIRDLKPIWLMSPLSVSDTLPLDTDLFDVVIFDEASQIPLEEAIPAAYRSHQIIVVGDEMQLPPTTFFSGTRSDDESVVVEDEGERIEVDLDSDSFLTQSAQTLPSTLLAWHYRSRYESLISFSNAAFYSGNLYTIPDRRVGIADRPGIVVTSEEQGDANVEALLERSISFHHLQNGIYENRRNPNEAAYIAQLVRGILKRGTGMSIGVVAFSEAQQQEIESALSRLADEDSDFSAQYEAEISREEDDVFCGLFVKNLENVQGDERDIIIMSVCYGHDANGRMLMNFGPINQRGGEKRLNVIFSRAKHHMALVSSIRHPDITNDFNDGANRLKHFLHYAEAVSAGDATTARLVLEGLNPLSRKSLVAPVQKDAVVQQVSEALRARGHHVECNVGQSRFRCDLAVSDVENRMFTLGVLVDTDNHYANPNLLDRYFLQPSILKAFGWEFALVLTKDWFHQPDSVLKRIEKILKEVKLSEQVPDDIEDDSDDDAEEETEENAVGGSADDSGNTTVAEEEPVLTAVEDSEPRTEQDGESAEPVSKPARWTRLEFTGGSSRKFWEIGVDGSSFTVRFGRMGTDGQSQTKTFADDAKAQSEAEKLIASKLKKGYVEKSD